MYTVLHQQRGREASHGSMSINVAERCYSKLKCTSTFVEACVVFPKLLSRWKLVGASECETLKTQPRRQRASSVVLVSRSLGETRENTAGVCWPD